jgi:outer membrane receptor protein involved in Fe transport
MGTAELEGDQHLSWQASLYRTDVSDDIELVASSVIGRGYFRNIAAARRQGLEASMRYDAEHFSATLGYSYTDATYLTGFALNSPENPKAGEDGLIFVRSGDHLPNIPTNVVKGVGSYTDDGLTLSLAARAASGQYLEGDEANLNARTSSYFVIGAATRYRFTPHLEVFGGVDNLFNRAFATFGGFSPTSDVPLAEAPDATNPRSLSPAPPRTFYGGLRAMF